MEKSADRFCFGKLVVSLDGLRRRQDMRCNLALLQEIERLAWDMKALLHPSGKHDDGGPMVQQFLHVSALNAGLMTGARFSPVPFL